MTIEKSVSELADSYIQQNTDSSALIFFDNKLLIEISTMTPLLSLEILIKKLSPRLTTIFYNGSHLIVEAASEISAEELQSLGFSYHPVKPFLSMTEPHIQQQIIKAYHWLNWHHQSKYCGKCGGELLQDMMTPEKKCQSCKQSFFPRFSPAVMVLIYDDERVLLARSPHFPPGEYSAIAGFIDVGETAEEAAHREVKEELDIEITDLEYFSTQTWPFPDSFMIAFTARFLRGEVTPEPGEIEDAKWFSRYDLPKFSPSASIARKLISSAVLTK